MVFSPSCIRRITATKEPRRGKWLFGDFVCRRCFGDRGREMRTYAITKEAHRAFSIG